MSHYAKMVPAAAALLLVASTLPGQALDPLSDGECKARLDRCYKSCVQRSDAGTCENYCNTRFVCEWTTKIPYSKALKQLSWAPSLRVRDATALPSAGSVVVAPQSPRTRLPTISTM
jgi:hypothetical protein